MYESSDESEVKVEASISQPGLRGRRRISGKGVERITGRQNDSSVL